MNGIEFEYGEFSKSIRFDYDGRTNEKQKLYFETLFDDEWNYKGLYDEYAYFGAFRCSKSFSQQLAVYVLCVKNPGLRVCFIKDTYDQLTDSVIAQFNNEFEYLGAYKYLKASREANFKNGSVIKFRAFDYDTNILSAEYDVIAGCQAEDFNKELFLQLVGRASGRVLGKKGILLFEGNPSAGWCKERYKDQTKEQLESKRIFFLEGQTQDNPHITQEYIQSLIDNYPKFWLDRYLYGFWDNREELIFSEFNEKEHVIEPIDPEGIPKDYIRRNALDWGWVNPSAILYSFVDYDGNLIIYDEFYNNKTMPEDIAREGNRHGKVLTVADHAMKGLKLPTKEDENKTVWSEVERNGLMLSECNKEELSNIVLTNSMFKQKKLLITRNCANLLREVKNWKWKRLKLGADKNMPEEPVDKDNHSCDCLNYLVADIFGSQAVDKGKKNAFGRSLYNAVIKKEDKVYTRS
jgi:phage terminase large subunit